MTNRGRGTSARNALGFSNEVREKMGLTPKAKLPPEGIERSTYIPTQWGLVETWVYPFAPNRRRGDRRHRTVCICPRCGKQLSAGRLAQHMVVHPRTPREAGVQESPNTNLQHQHD